jgi:transposase
MVKATSRADRQRGGSPTVPVSLTREQRAQVEAELRRGTVEKRVYLRARALLMMADGIPASQVAWTLHVHERTAEKWRQRFRRGDPVAMLADAPRAGRPHSLSRKPIVRA